MKKHIPNSLTLLNLFCGCLAVVFMLEGNYLNVFWCVLIAEFADLFDGLAARILNAHSPIGQDLDSLADMVTFGVVPGLGMFKLLEMTDIGRPYTYLGFFLTLMCCVRLAKYNVDTRKSNNFFGLATPSTSAFVVGLVLIVDYQSFSLQNIIVQPVFLFAVIALFSWLMLSSIPMFNLKFESNSWKGNELRYSFMSIGIAMIFVLKWASISFAIAFYIVLSVLFFRVRDEQLTQKI